jgi:hypothetical protein
MPDHTRIYLFYQPAAIAARDQRMFPRKPQAVPAKPEDWLNRLQAAAPRGVTVAEKNPGEPEVFGA